MPTLNYALTLEHLKNVFYRDGLETFSDELINADALPAWFSTSVPEPAWHAMLLFHVLETLALAFLA